MSSSYPYTDSGYPYTRIFVPPSVSVTATHRRRWGVLVFGVATFAVALIFYRMIPEDRGETRSHGAALTVVMADSRVPVVPNEGEPIPYWTLTTLINHHYAREQGADFVYVVHEHDAPLRGGNTPICRHPRLGWRAASWCKLPAVWEVLRTRSSENVVYIDTDGMFLSTALKPSRHLDHLTPDKPIGFVSNEPWDAGVCAGYFFLRREAAAFIKAWWDTDVPRKNLHRLWEQEGLNKLLKEDVMREEAGGVKEEGGMEPANHTTYADHIVHLADERQFTVQDSQQLILHITSEEKNRYDLIRERWDHITSLKDRDGMRALLAQVDIVRMNTSEVALRIEAEE
ncbi:hypothetical protein Q8F55_008087 [Vanrija albida]|uniref:Nucleotide-diphospho-sugar transferase domain-containing protein n=1 Tax=Vanrija albida TaxID=181172 RepID=A0ABR3PVB4_9TREE